MPKNIQLPRPEPQESLERFTVRAHRLLLPDIPDVDERNEAVWYAWRQANGATPEEQMAGRTFATERYRHVPNVCVFDEHETTNADGQQKRYTVTDLARICRNCNERIADAGAFTAISDGHTSGTIGKDRYEPPVLGYAGPYRLGMVGRVKPRFAIFQDEYHHADATPILDKKRNRSVELWTLKDGRRLFYPVAAIGSDMPRTTLPVKYSCPFDVDATLDRYTYVASLEVYQEGAAGATGSSSAGTYAGTSLGTVHVPQHEGCSKRPQKTRYATVPDESEAADSVTQTGDRKMPLSSEDIREFIDAISKTPQFQLLDKLGRIPGALESIQELAREKGNAMPGDDLEAEAGGETQGNEVPGEGANAQKPGLPQAKPENAAPPTTEPSPAGTAGDQDDLADLDKLLSEESEEPEHQTEGDEGEGLPPGANRPQPKPKAQEKFAMAEDQTVSVEKYSMLERSHKALIEDSKRMHSRIEQLERGRSDAQRALKLRDLAQRHAGFVDVDEESKALLYSMGSNLTDEQADAHLATVEKYAERAHESVLRTLPGDAPRREEDPERYSEKSAQINKLAVSIASAFNASHPNQAMTYDEARAEAVKRLSA